MKQLYKPKHKQLHILGALLLLTVLAMALIQQGSRHQSGSPFARPYNKSDGDTLDIGIELNPTIYYISGDSVTGRDYHILQALSSQEGVPMKFHPFVPLAHAMDYLDRGLYDIVVTSIPATTELKSRYLTTDPVYLDREILVQLADSAGAPRITSILQLAGDTISIPANSSIADRIRNLSREIGDTIYIQELPGSSAEHLFLMVASGLVKYAVINEGIAQELSQNYPRVDISLPISFNQFQTWILAKDNVELRDSVNAWINRLRPRQIK